MGLDGIITRSLHDYIVKHNLLHIFIDGDVNEGKNKTFNTVVD